MDTKQTAYASLSNESDISLADTNNKNNNSMISVYETKNNESLSQSVPLLSNNTNKKTNTLTSPSSNQLYTEYRPPQHTLSNKSVKLRGKKNKNMNKYLNYNYNNNKYIFRPYRCCLLFILPIIFSISMVTLNEIETLSCSDCDTVFFDCEYFYQYTCHLHTIEACCYDVNDLLYCQTFKYDSEDLHFNTQVMKDLRYVINICGDMSYGIIICVLFIVTIIWIIFEKIMKIMIFKNNNINNYDKIFLISWILVSIILIIPLYFYFDDKYLKCSNWNTLHLGDGENILPGSDENKWSMGATLWMSIGSFCQIWLIGFCGCTFNKGIHFHTKNFGVDDNKNKDEIQMHSNHSSSNEPLKS